MQGIKGSLYGVTRYFGTNHLGSTTLLTDANGDILMDVETTPFGEQEDKSLFFTGKQWDEDAELYYFNARFYDPSTGRFITEDPMRDGLLWAAFVNNNPMGFVDRNGFESSLPGALPAGVNSFDEIAKYFNGLSDSDDSGNSSEESKENTESAEERENVDDEMEDVLPEDPLMMWRALYTEMSILMGGAVLDEEAIFAMGTAQVLFLDENGDGFFGFYTFKLDPDQVSALGGSLGLNFSLGVMFANLPTEWSHDEVANSYTDVFNNIGYSGNSVSVQLVMDENKNWYGLEAGVAPGLGSIVGVTSYEYEISSTMALSTGFDLINSLAYANSGVMPPK